MSVAKSVQILVGCVCGIPDQTCMISKKTRTLLGVDVGSVIRIESEDNSTQVSRRVIKSPAVHNKDDFVFLSPEDLNLLNVKISDNVGIRLDPEGLECP